MENREFSLDSKILVPVHKDDFKKMNEFAECAWICREPTKKDEIRETRKALLGQVNNKNFNNNWYTISFSSIMLNLSRVWKTRRR